MKKRLFIGGIFVVIAIYFGIKAYAAGVAEERINLAIEKNANIIDVDYEKVSVDLPGMDVRISDVLVSPPNTKEKIKINEIIIHDFDDKSGSDIPQFMSVSIKGIEFRKEKIRELGYTDTLWVNINADYIYEKEKKELNVKKIGVGADNAGEINIGFHLSNIDFNPKQAFGILFTYPQILLHEAKIAYKDESLAERFFKFRAKQYNMDVKAFKKTLIQSVMQEIEEAKDDFTKKALIEIRKFIDDPEEFSVSVSPSSPCPLGSVMRVNTPSDIIKRLNIRITS